MQEAQTRIRDLLGRICSRSARLDLFDMQRGGFFERARTLFYLFSNQGPQHIKIRPKAGRFCANQGFKNTEALPKSDRFFTSKLPGALRLGRRPSDFLATQNWSQITIRPKACFFSNQGFQHTEARPEAERFWRVKLPGALTLGRRPSNISKSKFGLPLQATKWGTTQQNAQLHFGFPAGPS